MNEVKVLSVSPRQNTLIQQPNCELNIIPKNKSNTQEESGAASTSRTAKYKTNSQEDDEATGTSRTAKYKISSQEEDEATGTSRTAKYKTSSQEEDGAVDISISATESVPQQKPAQHKESEQSKILSIPINLIVPNPNQPRKNFSEASILKLADSLRQFGIIQPLTVRNLGHHYELIAGERRLRAAKELGWDTVPCITASISDAESAQMSIIENLIREDLNIFEQALAIEVLIDTHSLTQEQIAEKLSSSQSYIANKLRLLRLNHKERELILKNNLTERHARAILRINDTSKRESILNQVISEELNVARTEALINSILSQLSSEKAAQNTSLPTDSGKAAQSTPSPTDSEKAAQNVSSPTDSENAAQNIASPLTDSEKASQNSASSPTDSDESSKCTKSHHTYKDISSFYNAISRAIDCGKSSNLDIKSRKFVGENYTEITIILPNPPSTESHQSTEQNN